MYMHTATELCMEKIIFSEVKALYVLADRHTERCSLLYSTSIL